MKINEILWEFKEFFFKSMMSRIIFFFMFLVIMLELILPKIDGIFSRAILILFIIGFSISVSIDSLFMVGLIKHKGGKNEK